MKTQSCREAGPSHLLTRVNIMAAKARLGEGWDQAAWDDHRQDSEGTVQVNLFQQNENDHPEGLWKQG